jgi:hypothetical protein
VTSLLKIFIDRSKHSNVTHRVQKMMVVMDALFDHAFPLRLLRNQIVSGSQNLWCVKTKNNPGKTLVRLPKTKEIPLLHPIILYYSLKIFLASSKIRWRKE